MAAITFPSSPTTSQVFTSGSKSWIWSGSVWNLLQGPTVTPASIGAAPSSGIDPSAITGTAIVAGDHRLAAAWVNFSGVTTVTIRASYNVSSVTRASAGAYTINFTTAMGSSNYAVVTSAVQADVTLLTTAAPSSASTQVTGSCSLGCFVGTTATDASWANAVFFK